jgi:hypothetical protein
MQKKYFQEKKNNNGDHGKSSRGTTETMNVRAILDICTAIACMLLCS